MKTLFYKTLSCSLLMGASYVIADTVAVADIYQIVRNLPALEQVQEDMQKETTLAQNKLNNKKVQLDAKIQEFESNKDTLSDQKMDKIRKEITTLQRELKYLEADLREDLAMREQEQRNILVQKAIEIASSYASKNHIDVIWNASENVVYVAPGKDVTDAIILDMKTNTAPVQIDANKSAPAKTTAVAHTEPAKKTKK